MLILRIFVRLPISMVDRSILIDQKKYIPFKICLENDKKLLEVTFKIFISTKKMDTDQEQAATFN
jgi:hypothetical protein